MTQKIIIRIGLILIILLGINYSSFGQLKKANNHFEDEEYSDAILYYVKALKKDGSNKEATQNLAFSYRKLKDYANAEIYYAKATNLNPEESANFLYYGQTLKNNNKLKEAKAQFEKFVEKNPTSFIGKLMVQSCGDIKDWDIEEKAFEVSNMENINTKDADFCPLVYEKGIVFVSERGIDLVNANHSGMANKPYLSIFYAKKDKEYKKAKHFSNQLSSLYHDGPVSISGDGAIIYFTRADKKEHGRSYINRLQIFFAKIDGKKWRNITPFKYNSQDYSVAHPWLSEDGKQLFFASDMPGGLGGMDIYMCNKEGENWSKPINLGKGVNTSENEVFPYIRKGTLYFSSEGHSGYGGLDIYAVKEVDQWQNAVNLKSPLNSSKDDFGIFYRDDENGYFSSNREGGMGSDDIYRFSWRPIIPQTEMSGILEYEKLGASGATINLLDEDDQLIQTMITDEYGKFKFDKLALDQNYILAIESEDDSFLEGIKLFMTNSKGEKVLLANRVGKGRFKFQALPYDYYDELELLNDEDENLLTADVFGQLYEKLPGDYSGGMEVWVVDDEGNIIGRAKADEKGFFLFEKLSQKEQYLFMLAEDDPAINMIIVNEQGEILDAAKRLIDGKYRYVKLNADENVLSLMSEIDESIIVKEGDVFVSSKIRYEYRSFKILKSSAKELDKMVAILKNNKDVGVDLGAHTDSKGSFEYNMNLAQKRADAAVSYMVSHGISKTRIKATSYGQTKPIAPNTLPNGEDNPEGRAKNRRIEFKVIKLK